MEFKGTKGEWEFSKSEDRILFERPNMDLWFDSNKEGLYDGITYKEVKANAKLIAAAPELLEALKDYLMSDLNELKELSRLEDKAKKAIEKAIL